MKHVPQALLVVALATGCPSSKSTPKPPTPPVETPVAVVKYDRIARVDFNRRAAEHALPLFWRTDADEDKSLDPDELVGLWGWDGPALSTLVTGGAFTPAFTAIYETLTADTDVSKAPAEDQARRTAILTELSQGKPTLVETDVAALTDEDRAIIDHIVTAAGMIEKVHAKQNGVLGLADQIPPNDPASKMVFWRNQSPLCQGPRTENDPNCIAIAGLAKPKSGLYPAALQDNPKFCELLAKQPNGKDLTGHFSVVVDGDKPGTYRAVPYSEYYQEDLEAIAKELEAAAAAIKSPGEAPFADYLSAAAEAFRTNAWETADESWLAMGVAGSKWYLRIAADEVYYEPCALKAGFHVSFARINPTAAAWRDKLDPIKVDMENALAKLAGKPYKARKVAFLLPDGIDIIINAGDSRSATGATIGQSLPNWGKVKTEGGRTVVMTNLYTDAESTAQLVTQTSSLFCKATQEKVSTDPNVPLLTTLLHETAHNLGPQGEYKVSGKVDDQIFGGPLSSMMEENKSQTAALYLQGWLVGRGLLTEDEAAASNVRAVAWAFGHIAQGMYTGEGAPKAYSQLSSIQLGTFLRANALVWKAEELAANGTDTGCFEVDLAALGPAVDKLTARVFKAKGKGDKKDALAMKATFVDAKDDWATLRETIAERWLRAPKASFVYSLKR